jgi:hypothetical protein
MSLVKQPARVPEEFAPAKLFLEDIEEIASIFDEAERYRRSKPLKEEDGRTSKILFDLRDLTYDGLADLENLGGQTAKLTIRFKGRDWVSLSLSIDSFWTKWSSSGLTEEGEWWVYGRLQAVFERRLVRWRHIVQSLFRAIPWWALLPINIVLTLSMISDLKSAGITPGITGGWSLVLLVSGATLILTFLYLALFRHTIVMLRYSTKPGGLRSEIEKYIPYAVTAAITAAVTLIIQRLLSLLWP